MTRQFMWVYIPIRMPRYMLFLSLSIAVTSTGRYLPYHKFLTCSGQCSLRWIISLLITRYIVDHLKNTTRPTALNGANFLTCSGTRKTLHVAEGLVEELTRCLQPDDGELPLELLPELQELTYSGGGNTGGAFTSFIDARQNTGRPVTLIRL
jgi:hypothetical protein